MKLKMKTSLPGTIIGAALTAAGIIGAILFQGAAIEESATNSARFRYVLFLLAALIGFVILAVNVCRLIHPQPEKKTDVRMLTLASLFAALCYVGFTFLKFDIPAGTEKTAFHLGNVFCVLGALLLGGFWGGMAGAVGMTIADLTTAYVTSAPKTFLLKLCIGLIVGLVAHKIFHIAEKQQPKKLLTAVVLSCNAGMAFNVIADPLVGYFYKTYVLGIPQEAAKIWAKIGTITTLVNAVVAVVFASVLYLALRPALRRLSLLKR